MYRASLSALPVTLLVAGSMAGGVAAQNAGLDWLRFVGGPGDDVAGFPNGIEVTANGDIWLAGADTDTPAGNVQVTHLSATGTVISNWTFGGSAFDRANAIKVAGGLVLVAGRTESTDFPVTPNAVQTVHAGGRDFFYTVLDAATGTIVYSTLLGGSGDDVVTDLELDPAGGVWLYGATGSANFPTTASAFQAGLRGTRDVALARIDRTLSGRAGLLHSTFFGGDADEPFGNCSDLVIEIPGVLTFCADTNSTNLPVTAATAWQPSFRGGTCDAFVTRLDTRLLGTAQLVHSTYAGGSGFDNGNAMWVEGNLVTIAGFTDSVNLPVTPNAPQPTKSNLNDAYVLQLDISQPPAAQQRFGTYLGGIRNDGANDVAVDAAGCITITGVTGVFPTTPGSYQEILNPIPPATPNSHSFVARLDPFQGRLLYSTHVSTDNPFGNTSGTALRPDGLGGVLVVGRTNAPNLPVTQGPPLAGTYDAWLARLSLLPRGAARHGDSSWASGFSRSFVGVTDMPRSGTSTFAIMTSGAPGTGRTGCSTPAGFLLVALAPDPVGLPILEATLHLTFPIVFSAPVSAGRGNIALPLTGIAPGARAAFQFAHAYLGCSLLHMSNALEIVVQP